jgi:hypothetical protein
MNMRVCYLDCHEAGLCCYLVIHIENLLRPLQLFYFHLWPIYWLSLLWRYPHGYFSFTNTDKFWNKLPEVSYWHERYLLSKACTSCNEMGNPSRITAYQRFTNIQLNPRATPPGSSICECLQLRVKIWQVS